MTDVDRTSRPRRIAALVVTAVAAPLIALLAAVLVDDRPGAATVAFVAAGLGLPMLLRSARAGATVVLVLAAVAAVMLGAAPALLAAAAVHGVGVPWLARQLPVALDGVLRGWRGWLWGVLALLTVANGARVTVFMADPQVAWGASVPFLETGPPHMCMSAYLRAAELAPDAANLYAPGHYEDRETTAVDGMQPFLGDPYEYPPPFLLVPTAGLTLTHDFLQLRAGWYALQALLVAAILLVVARWIGGAEGVRVGLLLPLVWLGLPTIVDLQQGQVHLLVVATSVAAMVAFAARRDALGGALLAAAILTKLFPGILLVHLAVRRRWSALAWTLLASLVLVGLGLLVVGVRPWQAFVLEHLPRLQSGAAFGGLADGEVVARNLSIYGIVVKLDMLGVAGMTQALASQVAWLYTAALLVVAWRVGRRPPGDRGTDVRTWLALVNLAALRSPLAPAGYVASGTVWMIVLLAAAAERRGWRRSVPVFLGWLFAVGGPPLPSRTLMIVAGLPAQAITLVANGWPLRRRRRAPTPPR